MRASLFFFAALTLSLAATQVSAAEDTVPKRRETASQSFTCRIATGYGTAIGRGPSELEAKAAAREICGSKLIDKYVAERGAIDATVEDDLVLACVNLECQ